MLPKIKDFFDSSTNTITYIVKDPESNKCAIIDSVLDFDEASGRTKTTAVDKVINYIKDNNLELEWILETHVHADHLTAAPYIKEKIGGKTAINENVKTVQATFKEVFNAEAGFKADGSQFDHLLTDNEEIKIGNLTLKALHTPGHTPACMTYVIGNCAFVGDTIFMPDQGSARCDFPAGDAKTLYNSARRILSLPPETTLYMCHDYGPNGREIAWVTTVQDEKDKNIHLNDSISEDEFVKMRSERDAELAVPKLLLPAVQINMRAGNMPPADDNGTSYLKLPINKI